VIVYLDTSTVLRVVLAQSDTLPDFGRWERAYSSELLGVETRRVLDRLRLDSALDDAGLAAAHQEIAKLERSIGRVRLTRLVLRRAALPMPTVVKTLDALHLATALLLQERRGLDVTFATHDGQQAIAARALGFDSIGT
jgi:predicted nucleic acid-binding protein